MEYWKLHQNKFPILSILARQYLAIPATSALAERIFSQATDIITKKRNKLSKDTFKMIMLLKNWRILQDSEEELFDDQIDDHEVVIE